MDIPYGYDCFSFHRNEVKFFDRNLQTAKSAGVLDNVLDADDAHRGIYFDRQREKKTQLQAGWLRFTRRQEDYKPEQKDALSKAGRLGPVESLLGSQLFCGIKIQIGIGIVTNFLHKGLQFRPPNKGGFARLVNGSWQGIVSGLTVDRNAPNSYDLAIGNFLAYDEEFEYMNFGPFFAIESKLVLLTGSSRNIEASAFGANVRAEIYLMLTVLLLLLSILASLHLIGASNHHESQSTTGRKQYDDGRPRLGRMGVIQNFFFIYFTMLLNKISFEFDELIWPHRHSWANLRRRRGLGGSKKTKLDHNEEARLRRRRHQLLPTSIRVVSYLWSATCFVMASIYSGEMLAVILSPAEQNIDSVAQLINSKPPIEPVIRQEDFTYNLMLKSLDQNMHTLHNMTKHISRLDVYTSGFMRRLSERKQALLGDDELIETIYDIYHEKYPLHRAKETYLQYPISILYRKDLNQSLEVKLRRGMVQLFEMGLIHRWYQAQKETYKQFYKYELDKGSNASDSNTVSKSPTDSLISPDDGPAMGRYRPLTLKHFKSFLVLVGACKVFAVFVLMAEVAHVRLPRLMTA